MELKNLKTDFLGKKVIYFEEIDSTQKYIKNNISNLENGTVVITDFQKNGVGTHDRKWYSSKGENLTFSILLYPNCKVKKLEGLTKKIAEDFVEILKELYDINLKIKEPNDLILNNKKVCGILTETSLKGEKVENLIIGIGLNINQEKFPEEIKETATSLKKEYSLKFDKIEILKGFLEKFEKEYLNFIK